MFWIAIIVFLLNVSPALASATVVINTPPVSVTSGDTFPVNFSINNSGIGTSFHVKTVSAVADLSSSPTGCDSSYDNCLTVSVGESSSVNGTVYTKVNNFSGSFDLKIRIAQADTHSKTYESQSVNINSAQPTSTPTIPTNSPTPTQTPVPASPTPAPTSTLTPTSSMPTPIPTRTPTPTVEPTNTPEPTAVFIPTPQISPALEDVNGIGDIILPTPTHSSFSFRPSSALIPVLFIAFGGALLLVPILISKFIK